MKAVILITQGAVFKFDQDNVKKIIRQNRSKYDLDEVSKLLNQISNGTNHRIVIPEEPNYFDIIALDLIAAGHGSALCRPCNKWYSANRLKPVKVGAGGNGVCIIELADRPQFNRTFSDLPADTKSKPTNVKPGSSSPMSCSQIDM
jgi:hypothetical protein